MEGFFPAGKPAWGMMTGKRECSKKKDKRIPDFFMPRCRRDQNSFTFADNFNEKKENQNEL
jgi:hypothetical protein